MTSPALDPWSEDYLLPSALMVFWGEVWHEMFELLVLPLSRDHARADLRAVGL